MATFLDRSGFANACEQRKIITRTKTNKIFTSESKCDPSGFRYENK